MTDGLRPDQQLPPPDRQAESMAQWRGFVKRHNAQLNDILLERLRQDAKWGMVDGHTLDRRQTILAEEVGEVAKAILEGDIAGMRTELIQVAAVAVATVEALDGSRLTQGEGPVVEAPQGAAV